MLWHDDESEAEPVVKHDPNAPYCPVCHHFYRHGPNCYAPADEEIA